MSKAMKEVLNIPLETKFEVIKSTNVYTTPSGAEFFSDKVPEIKPIKGEFFVKRKNLELKPGDWVIFGVASTPSIDLVNDAILDVKYTFGDSLEEFVNSGRIFYEHGYKHAGNPSKHPDIDVPIGIPIAAEIYDNKLFVWILLDKNHELAQKVYKHLQSADDRFTSKIGLSIGAIPIGKPQTKVINGVYVNVPPKMRLYEVSITGQPINIDTFVKVLKSLVYNGVEKAMEEDTMAKDLKNPEEETQEGVLEALEEEVQADASEDASEEKQEMKQDEAQVLDLGDLQGEASEEPSEEDKEEGALKGQNEETQDKVALVQEEVEEHEKEDEETFNYILDKLDFLEEKLSEVLSMFSSKAPQEESEDAVVSSSLAELKSFVESKLASLENRVNYVVDIVEASLEKFAELKSVISKLESYNEKIESVEKSLSSFENLYKEVNEKLESTTKSLNSVNSAPRLGVNTEVHPQAGTFESNFQEKLKSVLANKAKLKSLEEKIKEYLTYKGTPIQLNEKKMELYNFAKEEFGLEPEEFELIYRQYKNNRKISQ
ncbi:prohead protease [Thermus phage TMA]|uniref:head maturation protease n=1 Tax=Thermus phage TMA TaxID=699370 RepID=UPI00021AAE56|nr:head maturation protease [Thermus phage TMA]BAK53761.1 prohead protease [Thermus phage TMA]